VGYVSITHAHLCNNLLLNGCVCVCVCVCVHRYVTRLCYFVDDDLLASASGVCALYNFDLVTFVTVILMFLEQKFIPKFNMFQYNTVYW